MDLQTILAWLLENWLVLVAIVYGLLNVANAVTSLTTTKKDDSVVAKIRSVVDKIVDFLSVLTKKDATNTIKLPLTKSKAK